MADWKLGKTQYSFVPPITTTGGTTVLIASSKQFQIFTGTMTQTMQLPDATTTSNGKGILFSVINESTGAISVVDNSSTLITTVAAGSAADILLTDVSSANGVWRVCTFGGSAGGGVGSVAPGSVITSNYPVISGDKGRIINVDSSGGVVNITLPAPALGFLVTVKDLTGYSSLNNITVVRNGSELIDTEATNDIISTPFTSETYISDGTNWFKMSEFTGTPPAGTGIFAGGVVSANPGVTTIDYISISVLANATSFGNLTAARYYVSGCSSSVTGIFGGGYTGSDQSTIDYVTIASTSNAVSFGSLTTARRGVGACSSSTRGVFGGGAIVSSDSAIIDYITIASIGNATSFGNLTLAKSYVAGCGSSTRGIFNGGENGSTPENIEYITIASTGNGTTFGNLTVARLFAAACSNAIRGITAGGNDGSVFRNTIDYITIATTGNAITFGTLLGTYELMGGTSSPITGVFGGGSTGSVSAVIQYVTINTLGNSVNFGNLTQAREGLAACSNSHGGL